MKHLRNLSIVRAVPLKAESLLVKQAQIEVAGQAVAVAADLSTLIKDITGQNGGDDGEE